VARCTGRADDVGAEVLGQLDREMPDTTASSVHQDAVAALHVRGVDERLPCGQRGQGYGRRLLVGDSRGLAGELASGAVTNSAYAPAARGNHGMP